MFSTIIIIEGQKKSGRSKSLSYTTLLHTQTVLLLTEKSLRLFRSAMMMMTLNTHIKGASIFEVDSPEDSPTTTIVLDSPENPILQGFPRAVAERIVGYESPVAFQLLSDLDDIGSQLHQLDPTARDIVWKLLKAVTQLTRIVDGQLSVINQLNAKRTTIR